MYQTAIPIFYLVHHCRGVVVGVKKFKKQKLKIQLTFFTFLDFCAQALSSHFFDKSAAAHCLRTTLVGAWYGNFNLNFVNCKLFSR